MDIKLIKSDSKYIYIYIIAKILFQKDAVLLNFLFLNDQKMYDSFHKDIKQHICFCDNNNKKYFLSTKLSY